MSTCVMCCPAAIHQDGHKRRKGTREGSFGEKNLCAVINATPPELKVDSADPRHLMSISLLPD